MTQPTWQKSTFSENQANCLEIAASPHRIHIRESDEPDAIITAARAGLKALILGIKAGEFDHLA